MISNEIRKLGAFMAYKYLEKDPESNLGKLLEWEDKIAGEKLLSPQRQAFRKIVKDEENHWHQLLSSLWVDISEDVRKSLFENLVLNANNFANLREKGDRSISWGEVINVPLKDEEKSSFFDEADSVIEEDKEKGTFVFLFAEKEWTHMEEDIIALCNKHRECQFLYLTKGDGVKRDFAMELLRIKNLVVAFNLIDGSIEEEQRRAMSVLYENKLPFGAYCSYEKDTMGKYMKEEFFDQIIDAKGKFLLLQSNLSEEEDEMYKFTVKMREKKPLLTINFCKDKAMLGKEPWLKGDLNL